jgi:trk system potassium uptake protein TrkH
MPLTLIRLGKEDIRVVMRDLGIVTEWSSVTFLAPLLIALFYRESLIIALNYLVAAAVSFAIGFALKNAFSPEKETDLKHAFLTASLFWLLYCATAALPFVLNQGMGFVDSYFEAMSALTTTGLTVMLYTIDFAPRSLVFWRSFLSWIGGVGIVVLALVGILTTYTKASKLSQAEGREERLKPNLKNTIREIWNIYIGLTLFGALLLYLSGMGLFAAINYSMSAISTTGMDIASTGLVGSNNIAVSISLVVIMVLGATSFGVHYLFFKKRRFGILLEDAEFKALVLLGLLSALMIFPKMLVFFGSTIASLEQAFFHAFSAITCGGFSLVTQGDIAAWDDYIKLVLVGVMFIGGSAGSTAGGIKLSRFIIFIKSIYWRIKEAILPEKSFFAKKFEGKNLETKDIKEVNQFILIWALFVLIGTIVLTAHGNSLSNSVFEVVSAQSNAGISTGISKAGMPIGVEIMLIINMWVGRLEIIPILSAIGFALSMRQSRR